MLHRIALCLFLEVIILLPAADSRFGTNLAQGQSECFPVSSLVVRLSLCGIMVLKRQHVKNRSLVFKGIGYGVKVSRVVALCHMLMCFHAINRVT